MKKILALLCVLATCAVASEYSISKNMFGSVEILQAAGSRSEKEVYFPEQSIMLDYLLQEDVFESYIDMHFENAERNVSEAFTCQYLDQAASSNYLYILPAYVGSINGDHEMTSYEKGLCFSSMTFQVEYLPDVRNSAEVRVTIHTSGKKNFLCKDWFLLATEDKFHIDFVRTSGEHVVTFKNLSPDDLADIQANGVRIYMFCNGVIKTIGNLMKSLKLFLGGLGDNPKLPLIGSHVPRYMEKANVRFMEEALQIKMEKRDITDVEIDENLIKSGDYFAIDRLDGLDQIIMYGTGSHSGHSTAALWIEGELHVVESQDGWYWPQHNIQRTPFKQWIQWAKNADFHVSWLPLRDDLHKKFNETAAYQWFQSVEGLPYGYHNFLFSWIDTPKDNLPPLLPWELLPVAFDIVEKIAPTVASSFIGEALNFRLGTKGLNMAQIAAEASKQGLSLTELMALPEQDGWVYSDGESYVCSCFVAGLWIAGGLFEGIEIQATEWSPKDVYQVDFFNTTYARPEQCVEADPDLPYCQLLGKYRMELPGFSTIKPYSHMNEHCPSVAPKFERPEGC